MTSTHRITFAAISILALFGCTANQEAKIIPSDNSDILKTESVVTAIPEGGIAVPGHGKEVGLAYGAIVGVNGERTSGIAMAHYLEDGATIMSVQANLSALEEGNSYVVWAMAPTGIEMPVYIGTLKNPFNDARHSVRFETVDNLSNYTRILISRNGNDRDHSAGTHVAEGILKPTSR